MRRTFKIEAEWDDEAEVWMVIGKNVPGLAIEGVTKDEVVEKLRLIVPALIEVGVDPEDTLEITFRPEEAMTVKLAA